VKQFLAKLLQNSAHFLTIERHLLNSDPNRSSWRPTWNQYRGLVYRSTDLFQISGGGVILGENVLGKCQGVSREMFEGNVQVPSRNGPRETWLPYLPFSVQFFNIWLNAGKMDYYIWCSPILYFFRCSI